MNSRCRAVEGSVQDWPWPTTQNGSHALHLICNRFFTGEALGAYLWAQHLYNTMLVVPCL